MHLILIHGMWLDASSWDAVVPLLERAGHTTDAVTLPGDAPDSDRSAVTLQDYVDAVVAAIDATDPADGQVVLVAHSAGGAAAHAAVDARPDRVARVVYLASEPRGTDEGGDGPFPVVDGEIPLPAWSSFDAEMVADVGDDLRTRMREQAVPVPGRAISDPQRLTDDRRFDVPATVITCEYSSAQLRAWMDAGEAGAMELTRLHDLEMVDLGGGHWPQLVRPEDAARVVLAAVDRG